jgi:integrase/recombinase XerC/integrase/recombinase XerD
MLRNGADVFSLQRLMGHSDLSILNRYLAQTDIDLQVTHMKASPVDNGL